jgi:hypothetical protein
MTGHIEIERGGQPGDLRGKYPHPGRCRPSWPWPLPPPVAVALRCRIQSMARVDGVMGDAAYVNHGSLFCLLLPWRPPGQYGVNTQPMALSIGI